MLTMIKFQSTNLKLSTYPNKGGRDSSSDAGGQGICQRVEWATGKENQTQQLTSPLKMDWGLLHIQICFTFIPNPEALKKHCMLEYL